MSLLSLPLSYGKTGTVELDVFTRMLNSQIYDNEEVRCDKPDSYSGVAIEYMGLAESGSSILNPVWNVIKKSYYGGKCVRMQFKSNIAWNERADPWPN